MEAVQKFFAENPEATMCYVALGMACATAEEANALLAGVKGQMVTPYNREAEKEFSKDSDALLSDLCEKSDAEAALEAAYQKEPTEAKMQEWVAAKKAVDKAKAAYEKKLADEKKTEGETGTTTDHVVTAEDLVNNPELVENGVQVGDTIQLPVPPETE